MALEIFKNKLYMIEINNLEKRFNKHTAVNIPFLKINKGEIAGLIGNNGAGKTTTFRLILDLIQADNGSILSNSKDVSKNEKWKDYTGSFIDSNFLIDFFTPEEYFTLIGKLYKLDSKEITNRLMKYEKFMNGEILKQKKYIRHFSSGNKQKIGIIAAMMITPEVLILDEPFNFLDPSSQIEMKNLLQDLNKKHNTTILISSHNLNYVSDVCTRIILLEKGNIVKDIDNISPENVIEIFDYFKK